METTKVQGVAGYKIINGEIELILPNGGSFCFVVKRFHEYVLEYIQFERQGKYESR